MFTSMYDNHLYSRRDFHRFLLVFGIIEAVLGVAVFFTGYLIGRAG